MLWGFIVSITSLGGQTANIYNWTTSLLQQNGCSLVFGTSIGGSSLSAVLSITFLMYSEYNFKHEWNHMEVIPHSENFCTSKKLYGVQYIVVYYQ